MIFLPPVSQPTKLRKHLHQRGAQCESEAGPSFKFRIISRPGSNSLKMLRFGILFFALYKAGFSCQFVVFLRQKSWGELIESDCLIWQASAAATISQTGSMRVEEVHPRRRSPFVNNR